jgi:hypothetical protein
LHGNGDSQAIRRTAFSKKRIDMLTAALYALAELLKSVDDDAVPAFDPSFALDAPTDGRALLGASDHHGCGSAGRFAMMPNHIKPSLYHRLWADVKEADSLADGCNNCRLPGWYPVWAAPGDVCDMMAHMPDATIHFHRCAEDGYAEDYKLEDHVKLCLKKEEIDWLLTHDKDGEETEHGHCQTSDGMPHLGPEGLLVCNKLNGCTIL